MKDFDTLNQRLDAIHDLIDATMNEVYFLEALVGEEMAIRLCKREGRDSSKHEALLDSMLMAIHALTEARIRDDE